MRCPCCKYMTVNKHTGFGQERSGGMKEMIEAAFLYLGERTVCQPDGYGEVPVEIGICPRCGVVC